MADAVPQNQFLDVASSLAKLAPIFLGSGTTEEETTPTFNPGAAQNLQNTINTANANATNPDITNGIVNSIMTQASQAFAPVISQVNSAGLYNSSTLSMLSSMAQAQATAQSSAAVLNFQTSQQKIAADASSNLLRDTSGTNRTAVTKPSIAPTVTSGLVGALALPSTIGKVSDLYSKYLGGGNTTGPATAGTDVGSVEPNTGFVSGGESNTLDASSFVDSGQSLTDSGVTLNTADVSANLPAGESLAPSLDTTTAGADLGGAGADAGDIASTSGIVSPDATAAGVLDAGGTAEAGTGAGLEAGADAIDAGVISSAAPDAAIDAAGIGATADAATLGGADAGIDAAAGIGAGADIGADVGGVAVGGEVAGDVAGGAAAAEAGADVAGAAVAGEVGADAAVGAAAAGAGAEGGADAAIALAALAWIICTELVRQRRMPRKYWIVGAKKFASYPEIGRNGYYLWAIPSVRHLRNHPYSLYSRMLCSLFNARAANIAASAGVRGASHTRYGTFASCLSWTVSAVLALTVVPLMKKRDWKQVYKEPQNG